MQASWHRHAKESTRVEEFTLRPSYDSVGEKLNTHTSGPRSATITCSTLVLSVPQTGSWWGDMRCRQRSTFYVAEDWIFRGDCSAAFTDAVPSSGV